MHEEGLGDSEDLLRRALELVENAKSVPLSSSVLVSREELAGLLSEALSRLPEELREARWLLKEKEDFLRRARQEADEIIEEARQRAEQMVSRSELVRQAQAEARRLLERADEDARRLRHEADDYCDQKLAAFEIVLERTAKVVAAGRAKLAGSRHDEVQEDSAGVPPGASGKLDILEGSIFDQDTR